MPRRLSDEPTRGPWRRRLRRLAIGLFASSASMLVAVLWLATAAPPAPPTVDYDEDVRLLGAAVPTVTPDGGGPSTTESTHPDHVVILLDTLRRDHLQTYGYPPRTCRARKRG